MKPQLLMSTVLLLLALVGCNGNPGNNGSTRHAHAAAVVHASGRSRYAGLVRADAAGRNGSVLRAGCAGAEQRGAGASAARRGPLCG